MGSAIVKGLVAHDQLGRNKITVCEQDTTKRVKLRTLGAEVVNNLEPGLLDDMEVIILAVKPVDFPRVLADLKGRLKPKQLVISIAAGVKLRMIKNGLKHAKVVRVMPNTPALIGEGMAGWIASAKVTAKDKRVTRQILQALGEEIEVKREGLMDAVTALSGSGPAYVFLFLESLIAGGVKVGLSPKESEKLAFKTLSGASELARVSKDDLETLRKKVTSKGGTTEAALKFFKQKKFSAIVAGALKKAYQRSQELGR